MNKKPVVAAFAAIFVLSLASSLIGCAEGSPGEPHLMPVADQKKTIQDNPNMPEGAKMQALKDIDRRTAAAQQTH